MLVKLVKDIVKLFLKITLQNKKLKLEIFRFFKNISYCYFDEKILNNVLNYK